jgi:hypothetical protein
LADISIFNDPRDVIKLIDAQGIVPSDDDCHKVLASAIFLSALSPREGLGPKALLSQLQEHCGMSHQGLQNWTLGLGGSFAARRNMALALVRQHVSRLWEAWQDDITAALDLTRAWVPAGAEADD